MWIGKAMIAAPSIWPVPVARVIIVIRRLLLISSVSGEVSITWKEPKASIMFIDAAGCFA